MDKHPENLIYVEKQKVSLFMGSIPVRDSEVFSSEKKKLVSTRTFLLQVSMLLLKHIYDYYKMPNKVFEKLKNIFKKEKKK